jgi:hypothetical protein
MIGWRTTGTTGEFHTRAILALAGPAGAPTPVLAEVAAPDGGSRLVTEARRPARTLAG